MKGKLRETGACKSCPDCPLLPCHLLSDSSGFMGSSVKWWRNKESLWTGLQPIMDVIIYHTVILTFAIQPQEKVYPSKGCTHAMCTQPKRPLQLEQLFKDTKLNLFTPGFLLLIILRVKYLLCTCWLQRGFPGRLWGLHPWRYSEPNWTQSWASRSGWPCLEPQD